MKRRRRTDSGDDRWGNDECVDRYLACEAHTACLQVMNAGTGRGLAFRSPRSWPVDAERSRKLRFSGRGRVLGGAPTTMVSPPDRTAATEVFGARRSA